MRRNRRLEVQLAVAGVLLMVSYTHLRAEESEASAIIELNRAILDALIVESDATVFENVALDQFVVVAPGGKVENKAQSVAGAASFDVESISITDEQVTFAGETAVLVGKLVIDGVMRPVGRLGPMKFMAVFVRNDEEWRLLARSLTICHEMAVAHGFC